MLQNSVSKVLFRGATILFQTIFYDAFDNPIQPLGAALNIKYFCLAENCIQTANIPMNPPQVPFSQWTAQWDSRGAGFGPVPYSIHCTGPTGPYSVEDGQFILAANNANLPTF